MMSVLPAFDAYVAKLTVAWAVYALFVAAMVPFVLRRVIVETFKCPEVQKLHVAPIDDVMERIPRVLAPTIITMSKNPEAIKAITGLLFSEKMQKAMNDISVSSLTTDANIRNFARLHCKLLAEPRITTALQQIFIKAMQHERIRDAIKLIIVEILVDPEVRQAAIAAVAKMRSGSPQTDEKFAILKQNCKRAIMETLNDEEFYGALVERGYGTVKTIIKNALMDPELACIFHDIIKDILCDEEIHKALLHGVMNAMKPNALSTTSEKMEEMRTSVHSFADRMLNSNWGIFGAKAHPDKRATSSLRVPQSSSESDQDPASSRGVSAKSSDRGSL